MRPVNASTLPRKPLRIGDCGAVKRERGMEWARILAYITGTVDRELLLRNEYLAAENRILKAQVRGRLCLSNADRAALGEIGHRSRGWLGSYAITIGRPHESGGTP
jgi:hypothetical protein